jgi:hypothetical protein
MTRPAPRAGHSKLLVILGAVAVLAGVYFYVRRQPAKEEGGIAEGPPTPVGYGGGGGGGSDTPWSLLPSKAGEQQGGQTPRHVKVGPVPGVGVQNELKGFFPIAKPKVKAGLVEGAGVQNDLGNARSKP